MRNREISGETIFGSRSYDEYFRLKEGMIPENISEKMLSASKIFVEQYTLT